MSHVLTAEGEQRVVCVGSDLRYVESDHGPALPGRGLHLQEERQTHSWGDDTEPVRTRTRPQLLPHMKDRIRTKTQTWTPTEDEDQRVQQHPSVHHAEGRPLLVA